MFCISSTPIPCTEVGASASSKQAGRMTVPNWEAVSAKLAAISATSHMDTSWPQTIDRYKGFPPLLHKPDVQSLARAVSRSKIANSRSSEGCSNGCRQQKLRSRRYRLPPLAKGFPTLRPKQPGMCTNIPRLCIIKQVHGQRASLPLCKIQDVRARSVMHNTMHVPAYA